MQEEGEEARDAAAAASDDYDDDELLFHAPNDDGDNLSEFYEVTDSFSVKFKMVPGNGVGIKIRLKNLDRAAFADETLIAIFDKVS